MAKNLSKYDDIELIKLLNGKKKNAEAAFNEIYRRYSGMIHAYCLKILGNEESAEDIFQDTFIKFFKFIKTDHEQTNVPGFLIKIARNLCLNKKRSRRQTNSIEDFNFFIEPNQNYAQKELLDLVNAAIDLLDFNYKEVFVLREYNDLSYREIGEILGISEANAKSRAFRARKKIKDILSPYAKDLQK